MSSLTSRRRGTRVVAGLLALGLVGGLALQACGSDSSSSSTDTTSADGSTTTVVKTTSLDDVKVEGDFGSKPTVTFDPSYVGTSDSFKVISEGDGPVITPISGSRSTTSASPAPTAPSSAAPSARPPDKFFMADTSLRPVITEAMVGQKVGSRVMIAVDDKAVRPQGEWNIVVFDIEAAETIPLSAEGTPWPRPPACPPSRSTTACPPSPCPGGDAADHARRAAPHQG